jgi:epoxide hydrolase-like predicted phosphatase
VTRPVRGAEPGEGHGRPESAGQREARPHRELRGLVVDWGGVLTTALQDCMSAWCEADGIDYARFRAVMREWLADGTSGGNPAHGLERGELHPAEFEKVLAERLTTRDGRPVEPVGLLDRMFAAFDHDHGMVGVVRRARQAGIRTALCSNSWGNDYPREGWDELFDAVVISGEVGMRKPEPRIYLHTARALGLAPHECVFVDDLPHNVQGAVATGMVGVRHVSAEQTTEELEALFGLRLSEPS